MSAIRRFRYWLGARLLYPHVRRLRKEYDAKATYYLRDENASTEQSRNNCAYISIGLLHAIGKSERRETARQR